jgi:hypothetical protein
MPCMNGKFVMRVDPVIPRYEKCTLVVEAIGGDKVRVNHQSLDSPLVILADQALEIIAAGKSLHIARAPRSADRADRAGGRRLRSGNQIGPCHSVTHSMSQCDWHRPCATKERV